MRTWVKALDWIGVAIFGVGALAMARYPQASPLVMAIHLLPLGTALIAFRRDASRLAVLVALGLNGLWMAGLSAGVTFILWSIPGREGLFVAIFVAVLAAPCLLNLLALTPSRMREKRREPSSDDTSFALAE